MMRIARLVMASLCSCQLLLLSFPSAAYAEWPDFALSEPVLLDMDGSKDAALIVCIEQYESFPRISGARTNAEAWVQFMLTSLRIPGRNVVRLKDNDAKDTKIKSALHDLMKHTKKGGRAWFVFIGHGAGSQEPGDAVLVGYDAGASPESIDQRSLRRSELLKILNEREKDQVSGIAILDTSFSGKTASGPLAEGVEPAAISSNTVPSHVIVMTAATDEEHTGPLQDVYPERPAFSYLMLGALRGWADKDKNGRVTAREAVTYADDMLQITLHGEREQHPSLHANEPTFVLSDGLEEAPALGPNLVAETDTEPVMLAASAHGTTTRDSGEPAAGYVDEDEALVHGIGSFEVGIGGGAPYHALVLFGEGAIGMRFGDYIRLTGVALAAASDFSNKDTRSTNPSLRPTLGVTGAAGLGVELARTSIVSVSADALGGVTYIGERCDNPLGDGAGNLICDRVQSSAIGPAGGARLAMQVRVSQDTQGVLISGTALTSKPTGLFGGVFLGYGAW